MPRSARKYLLDIQAACEALQGFAAGKAFADYEQDLMLRSAVERQFEIAGEALTQLVKLDPAWGGRITNARRIVEFRNRLIHGYSDISHAVVWDTLGTHLPILRREINELVRRAGA